jgi:hypothetical protein
LAALAPAAPVLAQGQRPAPTAAAPAAAAAEAGPKTFRQFAPGLLARQRFAADSAASGRVELWDLLVGPGLRSAPATLPGSAVLEVRAGSGDIAIAGKTQRLRSGAAVAVPEGATIQLTNARRDLGLTVRATIIVGRPQ